MSEDLYKRAASKDKDLYIVEGGTHVGMYDEPNLVGEGMSKRPISIVSYPLLRQAE